MKKISIPKIISFFISLIPIVMYLCMKSTLANSIPVHFDLAGKADSFASKTSIAPYTITATSLILFIAYVIIFHFILSVINKKSKENSSAINDIFDSLLVILTLSVSCLLTYYIFTIKETDTLNIKIPLVIITLTLGSIFVTIGNRLPKITQNKYAGFRTSELVNNGSKWFIWHRKIARIWVIGGILTMISAVVVGFTGFTCFLIINLSAPILLILIPLFTLSSSK